MLVPVLYQDYFSSVGAAFKIAQGEVGLPMFFEQVNRLNQTVTTMTRKNALQLAIDSLHEVRVQDLAIENLDKVMTSALTAILSAKGLRLPLATGKSFISSVLFWLQIIDVLVADRSSRWQIFWHDQTSEYKAAMTVYFKPIPPAYFSHLLLQNCRAQGLIDVMYEARQLEKAAEQITDLCSCANMSLMQLSQRLTDQKILRDLK